MVLNPFEEKIKVEKKYFVKFYTKIFTKVSKQHISDSQLRLSVKNLFVLVYTISLLVSQLVYHMVPAYAKSKQL